MRPSLLRLPLSMPSSSSASSSSPAIHWREGSSALRSAAQRRLNAFLRSSRARLASLLPSIDASAACSRAVVHLVMGNEAADADSIVSALVLAFAKHERSSPAPACFVPVLPISRAELRLRCDVMALFQALEVDVEALVFVDEFPWVHSRVRARHVALLATLVDHNALNNKRVASPPEVVEILDHHMDMRAHLAAEREVAFQDGQALVASTCTIVAERMLDELLVEAPMEVKALPATLLLGVIALDSVDFDPRAKKVTPRDVAVADRLEPLAFADRRALFSWLQAEKFNPGHWASFSLENCLQCDYKEFSAAGELTYGVSAVLIDLDSFARKAGNGQELVDAMERYRFENELQFLLVMTIFVTDDGERRRQLLFYRPKGEGEGSKAVDQCVTFFRTEGSLATEPVELPENYRRPELLAFAQRNSGASRKQVVPLIQQALSKL